MDYLKRVHSEYAIEREYDEDGDDPCLSSSSVSTPTITMASFFRRQDLYDPKSNRKIKLDRNLALMVVCDFQPSSIVEDKGCRAFVKSLDPKYELPSKMTLRNKLLPQIYDECKTKLLITLEKVSYCFSYMWPMVVETIQPKILPQKCQRSLKTGIWGEKKVCCIVTDNAASMIKACQLLKVRHHPCFAHTLNLVLQDALKIQGIDVIRIKSKTLVGYFKSSNLEMQKLICKQENKNKTPLKLLQEVPTHWNSALQMVKAPFGLTLKRTSILNDMICILDVFDEATNKVSGDNVTMSLIIPVVCGIYNHLMAQNPTSDTGNLFLEAMNEGVYARLLLYKEHYIYCLATILDPHMKKEGFCSSENSKAPRTLLQGKMAIKTVAAATAAAT
ncbi:hypothetical protein PR048_001980 [Dryococelus australis]|uniref:Uncharacterized protein n=1 Tax=Dryococelus australis TaxID=614101 RepID=A0ABQ9IJ18_9NEOP|nr:hypothetical protein PR048_001980 [Dryococelus australis]